MNWKKLKVSLKSEIIAKKFVTQNVNERYK